MTRSQPQYGLTAAAAVPCARAACGHAKALHRRGQVCLGHDPIPGGGQLPCSCTNFVGTTVTTPEEMPMAVRPCRRCHHTHAAPGPCEEWLCGCPEFTQDCMARDPEDLTWGCHRNQGHALVGDQPHCGDVRSGRGPGFRHVQWEDVDPAELVHPTPVVDDIEIVDDPDINDKCPQCHHPWSYHPDRGGCWGEKIGPHPTVPDSDQVHQMCGCHVKPSAAERHAAAARHMGATYSWPPSPGEVVIARYLAHAPAQGNWPDEEHAEGLAAGIVGALRANGFTITEEHLF